MIGFDHGCVCISSVETCHFICLFGVSSHAPGHANRLILLNKRRLLTNINERYPVVGDKLSFIDKNVTERVHVRVTSSYHQGPYNSAYDATFL